ncbi:MAG: low-specificity L-threonine aldolase [Deltaproteobacteria bacterium]|nr:MAG: low-specificity L-threonine aldolase [Deltaproteobacteria bacterium]
MVVDLRSDTVTKPTAAMRHAMAHAEVGDDVFGDDPTVNALEAKAAELAGKEAALFVTSGTMANQIAIRLHTQPGDEILMEAKAHPYNYEAGAAAAISGVQTRLIVTEDGLLTAEHVRSAIRPENVHFAPATLLCVEDTTNRGGGGVYPKARLAALTATAAELGLKTHLDGARVFNAVVASGIALHRRLEGFDTACFCLSKGLGAPVGSLLVGSAADMARARRIRKMMGGGMRQAGILAAAGLYALEHHVHRLADDHRRARMLAEGIEGHGFTVRAPETNIVYVSLPNAAAAQEALAEHGVRCIAVAADSLRLVTHLDVDDGGIARTIDAFGALAR